MRENKFRSFDKNSKEYTRNTKLGNYGYSETLNGIFEDENIVFEQFTGLHDKNGAEIYEGDVVKWDDCSNGEYWRFAVVQISPDIQFNCSLIKQVGQIKNSSSHIFRLAKFAYENTENHLEVIGNVLKNTELLS